MRNGHYEALFRRLASEHWLMNGKKVSASFNEMDAAAKKLAAQLNDLASGHPGRKQMVADYQALQDRIEGVKKEMGSAQEQSSVFKQALAFGGVSQQEATRLIQQALQRVGKELDEIKMPASTT